MSDLFTIHRREVKVDKIGEPIYLIPFGDVHRYAEVCDTEQWLEFLGWAKWKKNCYFLGMGDYDDFLSYSERFSYENFLHDAAHDETKITLDNFMMKRVDDFHKEIGFMGERLIGMIEGNHYGTFSHGSFTTTQKLCELMGTKYLGCNAFVRLIFAYGGRHRSSVDIWAHHGTGAAKTVGGSLNSVEQMVQRARADIYLSGHDHKKSAALKSMLELTNGGGSLKLTHRKILMARTGSFLTAYTPGTSCYAAQKQLNPADLGVVKIELTPRRIRTGGEDAFYMDIHCSI